MNIIKKISLKDEEFIKNNYLIYSDGEMAQLFIGVTKGAIASCRRRLKLIVPKEVTKARRIVSMTGRTTVTPEEDAYIRENYINITMVDIGKHLNRSSGFVKNRLKAMALVIPSEILAERRLKTLIKKGDTPPNKGKRQTEYMSAEAIERTKVTRFKKGQLPPNTKEHDGIITIRTDKSGRQYKYIRISLSKWELYQRVVWQKVNGPIPAGNVVVFKDGDSLNCSLDNLECITYAENMLRNTLHRYGPEIAGAIQLKGALNRKINRISKKLNDEKQNN